MQRQRRTPKKKRSGKLLQLVRGTDDHRPGGKSHSCSLGLKLKILAIVGFWPPCHSLQWPCPHVLLRESKYTPSWLAERRGPNTRLEGALSQTPFVVDREVVANFTEDDIGAIVPELNFADNTAFEAPNPCAKDPEVNAAAAKLIAGKFEMNLNMIELPLKVR